MVTENNNSNDIVFMQFQNETYFKILCILFQSSLCTYYVITEDSACTFYALLFSSSPYKLGVIFGGYFLTHVPLSVNFSFSAHSAPYNFMERGKVGLAIGRRETHLGPVLDGEKAEEGGVVPGGQVTGPLFLLPPAKAIFLLQFVLVG